MILLRWPQGPQQRYYGNLSHVLVKRSMRSVGFVQLLVERTDILRELVNLVIDQTLYARNECMFAYSTLGCSGRYIVIAI